MLGRQRAKHIDPIAARGRRANGSNALLTDPGIRTDDFARRDRDSRSRFWKCWGPPEICSFDASAFEGTTHVHDFNTPIEDRFKERYTVVFDGGSHEHIFNFPIAVRNCMEMLKVAGNSSRPQHRPTILFWTWFLPVLTRSAALPNFQQWKRFHHRKSFPLRRIRKSVPCAVRWRSTDPLILGPAGDIQQHTPDFTCWFWREESPPCPSSRLSHSKATMRRCGKRKLTSPSHSAQRPFAETKRRLPNRLQAGLSFPPSRLSSSRSPEYEP